MVLRVFNWRSESTASPWYYDNSNGNAYRPAAERLVLERFNKKTASNGSEATINMTTI
ncbi:hypothetical protein [Ureibacillus aquaedulcis]|uniref:Uncharacterized protein n=1 Tax=Ureibacillus aquaedulcis TaxID=3058421 RepID=A0ABT8GT28_9BACL|nr:hypothetical protein [Ureibacillus sp. BA0131]MDN4494524.1 hypothetical protein [Ureibacillus sp. BA0131]